MINQKGLHRDRGRPQDRQDPGGGRSVPWLRRQPHAPGAFGGGARRRRADRPPGDRRAPRPFSRRRCEARKSPAEAGQVMERWNALSRWKTRAGVARPVGGVYRRLSLSRVRGRVPHRLPSRQGPQTKGCPGPFPRPLRRGPPGSRGVTMLENPASRKPGRAFPHRHGQPAERSSRPCRRMEGIPGSAGVGEARLAPPSPHAGPEQQADRERQIRNRYADNDLSRPLMPANPTPEAAKL
jgi:hypothetical protein